ncbi:hypothetical protein [Rhodonellum sp.]|uniref:hypothetical protein n=1 Tax=Rhodonellum sp. TaxID=2231180 RepID=UPI00271BEBD5|nr:hypothetical protein [Rhodonellum sp.]MDO9554525.1 hypothetical protein [Rhodonellum sp.]
METLGPINVEFLLNSAEFKSDSKKVQDEINGIGDTAEAMSSKAAARMKIIFSDSAKEIADYQNQINDASNRTGPLVESKGIEEVRRQLEALVSAKAQVEDFFASGRISAEQYEEALQKVRVSEEQLRKAMNDETPVSQGASQETVVLDEKVKKLMAVSDEYRGVLESGMMAYEKLGPASKRLVLQLTDMDQEIRVVGQAQADLNKRFEEGTVDAIAYGNAMAALNLREAELKGNIKEATQGLKDQSANFDKMDKGLQKVNRNFSSFTYSAQQGLSGLANNLPNLVEEVIRMDAATKQLNAQGQKTPSVFKQIVSGVLNWQTALVVGIGIIISYRKEIAEWVKGLFSAKKPIEDFVKSQNAINEAFKGSEVKGAIKEIIDLKSSLDLAKKGMIDQKTVIDQYNESIGSAGKEAKTLADVEQGMIDNADKYVKATLFKAAALAAQEEIVKEMLELAKEQQRIEDDLTKQPEKISRSSSYAGGGMGAPIFSDRQIAIAEEKDLQKEQKENLKLQDEKIKKGSELVQKLKEQSLATGLNLFDAKGKKNILDTRGDLLKKIAALDAEYSRKSFSKDEEELQALRDKFSKVRSLVDAWNADPKNRANRIDLAGLDGAEAGAIRDLAYRQETGALKSRLNEEKEIYKEFARVKADFGIEEAERRYKGELDISKTYLQRIQEEYSKLSSIEPSQLTGGQGERLKFLQDELAKEEGQQLKQYDALLKGLKTYNEERLLTIEQYEEKRRQLIAKGDDGAAAELDRLHKIEMDDLDDKNVEKLESYKELQKGIEALSVKAAQSLVQRVKNMLTTEVMSEELRAEIERLISEFESDINQIKLENIFKISGAIGVLGASLQNLGKLSGKSGLEEIGGLLAGIANGLEDVFVSFDKDAKDIDKVIAGVSGLIKIIDMLGSAASLRREKEQEYFLSMIGLQNQYNLSLNEQIRLQSILGESVFLKDFEGRIKDGLKSITVANDEYQKAIDSLSSGMAKSGQRNAIDWKNVGQAAGSGAAVGAAIGSVVPVIGNAVGAVVGGIVGAIAGIFGGKKKVDNFLPILDEYPELISQTESGIVKFNKALAQSLIANNLVSEETKQILNNIIEWEDALEAARAQIKEVISELAGGLSNDLRNALVDAFKNGENAAIKMGETVDKVLENILSQLIFNRIFSDAFAKLEEEMASSLDAGGDNNWIDDFERFFKTASGLSDDFNKAMEEAMAAAGNAGFNIFKPEGDTEKQKGLTGAIRRELTEATGSELAGLFRGFFDVSKRSFQVSESMLSVEKQHYEATLEGLNYWASIDRNTQNTVEKLDEAVTELKSIVKNTKPGQSGRDLGLDG